MTLQQRIVASLQTNPHDGVLRVVIVSVMETWPTDEFWSCFDKKANFSWSKRALPFLSRLVYWLKMILKALCM